MENWSDVPNGMPLISMGHDAWFVPSFCLEKLGDVLRVEGYWRRERLSARIVGVREWWSDGPDGMPVTSMGHEPTDRYVKILRPRYWELTFGSRKY